MKVQPHRDAAERLAALKRRVLRALGYLGEPPAPWMARRAGTTHDVVIVGAGQAGLAIGFALQREGIDRVVLLDARPAGQEGPWRDVARMETLRSPKDLVGPEQGIAELTFRAWYEAVFGDDAYDRLGRIPTGQWMDYLLWYRDVADLPIKNDTAVVRIEHSDAGLLVHTVRAGVADILIARKVVLATGMDGFGRPLIPQIVRAGLPRERYAHCLEAVDFAALKGRRVAVLGAASSAFDYAAEALEAEAAQVDLFCRGAALADRNRFKQINYPGVNNHYVDLDDADKWRVMTALVSRAVGVIRPTLQRCTRHRNFQIHLNAGWRNVAMRDGEIYIETETTAHRADFAIVGTGFEMAPEARPELAAFADKIARWGDRYTPPPGDESPVAAAFPYIDPDFRLVEKAAGTAPFLSDIHFFAWAGSVSNGRYSSEVSSLRYGVPRLVRALCRDLVRADADFHVARIRALPEPEFGPDEYEAGPDR